MSSSDGSEGQAASTGRRPNYARRIAWLGVFAALLFGGYSAGWFYFAGRLEDQTRAVLAQLNHDGTSAECTSPRARGFPFRIGLYCEHLAFADARQGIGLSTGNVRTAAQVYNLRHIIAEIDGPAQLDLRTGDSLDFAWEALRASIRLGEAFPQRASVEGRNLTARRATGAPLAEVASFQAHMRTNGADVDLAGSVENLDVSDALPSGRELPRLSSSSDLTVTDGVAKLRRAGTSLRGQEGVIRTLSVSAGPQTGVTISGPFSIDSDGLLDAQFNVVIRDPQRLSAILGDAFPEARNQIATGFSGLAMLGSAPSLPLTVARGKASLGFIPLGDVPPL